MLLATAFCSIDILIDWLIDLIIFRVSLSSSLLSSLASAPAPALFLVVELLIVGADVDVL